MNHGNGMSIKPYIILEMSNIYPQRTNCKKNTIPINLFPIKFYFSVSNNYQYLYCLYHINYLLVIAVIIKSRRNIFTQLYGLNEFKNNILIYIQIFFCQIG